MLAELAAANAAFAVIKRAVQNGREIADCAKSIGQFVHAKEDLRHKGEKKKRSWFHSSTEDDLEEFMALEKIHQQEEELKQIMIYCGRPGLWMDWQRFQADARKRRLKEREEREKQRAKMMEWIAIGVAVLVCIGGVLLLAWWIAFLKSARAEGFAP